MIKSGRNIIYLLSLGIACLSLGGCETNMDDLRRYVNEVKQREADAVEPIPPIISQEPFIYTATDLRDPFLPVTSEQESDTDGNQDGPRPDTARTREYLEKYSLDTLAMVGTFNLTEEYWALVRDPDGVIHRVAVDNYLGQNHGKVTQIFTDRLELSELIPDGGGGWLVRDASIALEE